jgi:uncharacterized protein (DUF2141 family)
MKNHFFNRPYLLILVAVSSLLLESGCSLMEMKRQTALADNTGVIKGVIKIESNQKGPVVVALYADEDSVPVLQRTVIADTKGEYSFGLTVPGEYYIAAVIDANGDGEHQPNEHGNYLGTPTPFALRAKEILTVEPLVISGPVPVPEREVKTIDRRVAAYTNIGSVISLDDPRLDRANYALGLWRPLDFLNFAEGGLFFLQPYDPGKVPVIFVHGVLGGPPDWKTTIEALDQDRFQPWVLYYPSGLRLDTISDYLVEAVTRLQQKYGFQEFGVVAHSMGGLVTRSFVKKFLEHDPDNINRLRLVMTVNSPMAGMAAAASGVKYSPIIVPSWRDVEPGSDFLQKLDNWQWPRELPYHLVISYIDGESGDGVVPLQSQAQGRLQAEATRLYIYNDDHTGTINDPAFHLQLNSILLAAFGRQA